MTGDVTAGGPHPTRTEAEVDTPPGLDGEGKREWLAMWDADRESLADTGHHIETVMWSDDRAVGMRGWYY
jgi:hypothetical protein